MAPKPPPPQAPPVVVSPQPANAGPPPPAEGAPPDGTPPAPPPPLLPPPTHTVSTPPQPKQKPPVVEGTPPLTQPLPTAHVAMPKPPPPETPALPALVEVGGLESPSEHEPAATALPQGRPCPCEDCLNGEAPRQISKTKRDEYVMAVHREHLASLQGLALRPSRSVPAPGPKPAPPAARRCEFCRVPVAGGIPWQWVCGTQLKCRHCFCWDCLNCVPNDHPQPWQCPLCGPRGLQWS